MPSPLSGASITLHILFQADNIATKAKHVLATHSGGAAVGQISVEVLQSGAVRAFSDDAGNVAWSVPVRDGRRARRDARTRIVYQRQSNVAGWSQRLYVDGVRVAEDTTQRTWPTFATGTFYLGTWWDGANFLDPTDGLIAHVAGWNSLLTPVQIVDLARAQSVAWAEDIDAGTVQVSQSMVVSVLQGRVARTDAIQLYHRWQRSLGSTRPKRAATSPITAGGTSGAAEAITYSFTDANGNSQPDRRTSPST